MSDKVFQVITAASKGSLEELKKAFESGLSPSSVMDYDRRTPLHLAAAEGHLETVKYLLEEKKVDINVTDRFGNTPLQDAINSRYFLVAQYLRDKGAVSKQYDDLVVSLCRAASKNDVERIKTLLEEGADVNSADYDGRTALHLAASEGHYEAAELLISLKASVNIIDRWGSTPLQDAISHGHDKISELLMKYGARVEKDVHKIRDNAQFYSALQKAINLLCDKEKWEYAMTWVPHLEKNEIKPTDAWYGLTSGVNLFAQYRRACETVVLAPGQGLVGQVFDTLKPVWIRDTSADNYKEFEFMGEQKGQIPKEIGFKAAVGIPVIYNDTLVAILEFRSTTAREINQDVITFFSNVATRAVVSSAISDSPGQEKKTQIKLKGVYAEQMNVVYRLLLQEGMFSEAVILSELDWYYNGLGLNEYYFQHHSPHLIAKHILSYIAAKKYAQTTGTSEKIRFIDEEPSFGLYICPVEESIMIERMIEEKYFGEGYLGTSASIETGTTSSFALKHFLSEGTASPTSSQRIALYLVDNYPFVNAKASEDESDLWKVATGVFLRDKSSSAKHRYQKALSIATSQLAPAVIVEEDPLEPSNCVIVVAYKKGSTHSFLSTLTQLIAINKCTCPRKYIEQFSNGYVIHSIHLRTGLEEATHFAEQTKLLYMLPRTTLTPLFAEGKLTLNEMVYAYSCWKFAYHFMARSSVDEFNLLWKALEKDPVSQARLLQLKKRMRNDVLTEQRISDSIFENWQLVKELYKDFETHHKPATPAPTRPNGINAGLEAKIKKAVADIDYDVLRAFLVFNSSVVKTNFYIKNKTALSFRFDTGFLRGTDYPQLPYAILMFVGAEFRGFHVRFDDIARGGLRMIRSANKQAYLRNAETLFDENYNLAWTQEKKNKDIPESGSKGTILLSIDHQNKAFIAFKKYIDAMLDLLLPNSDIVDHYGLPEYIFCGPDEGTADVMDWACLHAKSRGYRYWTGFTTGKSVTLGGIPHDLYGMTTRGVHEYVLGIMKKLNIKEESVFKLQTGGPDGDLGSNEIKISKDKTKAIIDGSGVLYDPNGIDRTEMLRLANKRAMVQEFDTSKLSKDGFLVLIKDKDVKLPNGTIVENGMMFRNLFHLNPLASCELFVPCGGRPEAVNLNNVDKLFFPDGTPMFKYVIEGANLFFTQEARLKLEEAGVVVYKDASANKGGVTSSSMEVLAALALSEEEYIQHMCVKDGKTPEFYEKYVVEVQNKIADNARQEFECIWNEHERTGVYRCLLTDQLSIKINTLTQEVKNSGLWKDEKMRKKILLEALPQTLLGKISIDKIIERVPTNYLDALLSAHLASRYIYQSGLNPNEFSFYMFMAKYLESQK